MEKRIDKAGVVGAGVMGATIAAQLANVGIETILLDIVPPGGLDDNEKNKGLDEKSPEFRNRLAKNGTDGALMSKPASFYIPENHKLIAIGNLEDDLDKLAEVDWIIEVVVERLDIKQAVFEKIEKVMRPGTFVTSNTSGISAAAMSEGRSKDFREHFAITHFFNPPRYMKLLEIIPCPDTLDEVTRDLAEFCEERLGKGIVWAKDTPNFVANRIGMFSIYSAIGTMVEMGLTLEAVDKLTGPVVGHPKSASFRTADLVGLDTLVHVANNVYDNVADDEQRDMFKTPDFIVQMLEKKLLGQKVGKGFYKKSKDKDGKRVILSIDYNTLEYKPQEKVEYGSLKAAGAEKGLKNKIKALYFAKDTAGEFTRKSMSGCLIYSAKRLGEIADDIVNIDNAMKWGFGWELGPFETWDAIGVKESVANMEETGLVVPDWIKEMLASGKESFYKADNGALFFYDFATKDYKAAEENPKIILLPPLKDRNKTIAQNKGATLVDIGDGVACLEFHTKMNALDEDVIGMVFEATEKVRDDFDGLVIASHGAHFSAGANLKWIADKVNSQNWDELSEAVRLLQVSFSGLKFLNKPVVAAPAGMALGGGTEVCLAADRVRFAAETYMGLVEVGIGVIPAGGGTKELLLRNTEHLFEVQKGGVYPKQIDLMPFVARAFETIALAKVGTSGPEAAKIGYLRSTDKMTVNRDYLIDDAKNTVLAMNMEGYTAPKPREHIRVGGDNLLAMFKLALWSLKQSGFVLDHDVTVSTKVAWVLCGGNVLENTIVSEQYILDLEREAFMSLCGEPMTQARIKHMLEKGKPLRN